MSLELKKIEVMRQVLMVDDEEILDQMQLLLSPSTGSELSATQKGELDRQLKRMERGEGKSFPWSDVRKSLSNSIKNRK